MQWSESVGVLLFYRDLNTMHIRLPSGIIITFTILQTFPFTSETKRMGIIIRVRIHSFSLLWEYQVNVFDIKRMSSTCEAR